MSRAFVREDVDPPEKRPGRKRSASGLPPGAVNYMTRRGADKLRESLTALKKTGEDPERVAEIQEILSSIQIVEPPEEETRSVGFGTHVTVQDKKGESQVFTVVGVDELDLHEHAVSWISPDGRAILAGEVGQWIALEDGRSVKIVGVQ